MTIYLMTLQRFLLLILKEDIIWRDIFAKIFRRIGNDFSKI